MTRGFLQIAGFTFGKATSFFEIVPGASFSYNSGMFYVPDTGDAGKMLAAYTAQFGNGVSGTIALEQSRVRGIARVPGSTWSTPGAIPLSFNEGGTLGINSYPDLVGNIRIDQAWGTWLVGAALKYNRGTYFGATMNTGGHDADFGWAVTTGFIWNMPFIAPGDRLSAGVVYSEGAIGYAAVTPTGGNINYYKGAEYGAGFWTDAVYSGAPTATVACPLVATGVSGCGQLQLTTAWSAAAMFEHLWTPALRTSIYGSYISVSHNGTATNLICNADTGTGLFQSGVPSVTGCDPDFSAWNVGSRTQWEPVKGLIMGVDVIYNKLNTSSPNFTNRGAVITAAGGIPATTTSANCANGGTGVSFPGPCYIARDQDAVTTSLRIQRDFLP
jgi:hypothetical protein